MAVVVSYLDYPIYSICSNGNLVLTSGGGGGPEYGIEDKMELHEYDKKCRKLISLSECYDLDGVVDSVVYSSKVQLWAGCLKNGFVLCMTDGDNIIKVIHKFTSKPSPENLRQTVARFSYTGEFLITGGEDCVARIWRINSHFNKSSFISTPELNRNLNSNNYQDNSNEIIHLVNELIGHTGGIKDCDISLDSNLAVTCSSDYTLRIWDIKTGKLLHTQESSKYKNKETLCYRCCRFLQASDSKNTYKLLTVASGVRGVSLGSIWSIMLLNENSLFIKKISEARLHTTPCCSLIISSDEQYFASGHACGTCKLFNMGFKLLNWHQKHQLPVTGICFTNRNLVVVSSGADYSIVVMGVRREASEKARRWILKGGVTLLLIYILLHIFVAAPFAGFKILTRNGNF